MVVITILLKMEAKRNAILDLIHAGKSSKEISLALNVHRNTVNNVRKLFLQAGGVKKRSGGSRKSMRTKQLIQKVRRRIKTNPWRSVRKMAKEMGVSNTTLQRIVKKDLHATSRAITTKQLVTEDSKEKREARAKLLLNDVKHSSGRVTIFSDEKLFCVDRVLNRRNSRYISSEKVEDVPEHVKHVYKTKHPAKVMVLGVVASHGKKCPIIFIPQNDKVNSDVYINLLTKNVLPWLRKTYPDNNYVWQQDGAPCHTSRKTQKFLQDNMAEFWGKDMWPPNSPDLNPLDYSIWASIEKEACKKPHSSVSSLKASIRQAWGKMDPEYIRKTCKSFRPRLEAVLAKNGRLFE